jgi:hypothetical protein
MSKVIGVRKLGPMRRNFYSSPKFDQSASHFFNIQRLIHRTLFSIVLRKLNPLNPNFQTLNRFYPVRQVVEQFQSFLLLCNPNVRDNLQLRAISFCVWLLQQLPVCHPATWFVCVLRVDGLSFRHRLTFGLSSTLASRTIKHCLDACS